MFIQKVDNKIYNANLDKYRENGILGMLLSANSDKCWFPSQEENLVQ